MKIKGIKSAVGVYREVERKAKKDNAWYAEIMLHTITGDVWCDTFYDLSHGSYKRYYSTTVINLSAMILFDEKKVAMKTVKEYAEAVCR